MFAFTTPEQVEGYILSKSKEGEDRGRFLFLPQGGGQEGALKGGRLGGGFHYEIFWQTPPQNPQLTPSKLENSEQKNILPEKTPKIVCNSKTLNLKILQSKKPKVCNIFGLFNFQNLSFYSPKP